MATKSEISANPAPAAAPVSLSKEEILRYSRHLIMPEVGMEGQLKLKQAKVLCIGTGGLGAPLGLYLAAAGVGRIGLVDFDTVDSSNLQRQILFGTKDVGRPKIAAAGDRLRDLNPDIQIDTFETHLSSENALDILKDYDIIVDGTDNFPTRYLVNDASVLLGKPNVYGSIFRFEGQVTVFGYPGGPCYRCLYPEPPPPGLVPSCAEGGVLGVLPGIVGSIQAAETLKLIIGVGEHLVGRLLLFDALAMRFRELKLRKNPDCPSVRQESDDHQADRLRRILRHSRRRSSRAANFRPRNHSARTKSPSRPRRRSLHPRRARTARISDLQSGRPLDPARRSLQTR